MSNRILLRFVSQTKDKGQGKALQIRPMCPTQWLVRVPAVQAVQIQYEQVLDCLEEMAQQSAGASIVTRASGLLAQFNKGITVVLWLIR